MKTDRSTTSSPSGMGKMPGYSDKLTEEDRWKVIHYVRALQRAMNPRRRGPGAMSAQTATGTATAAAGTDGRANGCSPPHWPCFVPSARCSAPLTYFLRRRRSGPASASPGSGVSPLSGRWPWAASSSSPCTTWPTRSGRWWCAGWPRCWPHRCGCWGCFSSRCCSSPCSTTSSTFSPGSTCAAVEQDHLLQGKAPYLNFTFWTIRAVAFFALWIGFTRFFVGRSLAQDRGAGGEKSTGEDAHAGRTVHAALCRQHATFAGIDWLMSLEPHWFSTIFGVYLFAGMVLSSLAAITIITIWLMKSGRMEPGADHPAPPLQPRLRCSSPLSASGPTSPSASTC